MLQAIVSRSVLLPSGKVAGSAGERRQAGLEPAVERPHAERPDPGRRELDRERQRVEPPDRCGSRSADWRRRGRRIGSSGSRAVPRTGQRRRPRASGPTGKTCSPETWRTTRLVAMITRRSVAARSFTSARGTGPQVLEVVDDEKHLASRERRRQRCERVGARVDVKRRARSSGGGGEGPGVRQAPPARRRWRSAAPAPGRARARGGSCRCRRRPSTTRVARPVARSSRRTSSQLVHAPDQRVRGPPAAPTRMARRSATSSDGIATGDAVGEALTGHGPGFAPSSLVERVGDRVEDRQRLVRTRRAVRGQDRVLGDPLVGEVRGEQAPELGKDLGMPPEAKVRLDPVVQGERPQSLEPRRSPPGRTPRSWTSANAGPRQRSSARRRVDAASAGLPARERAVPSARRAARSVAASTSVSDRPRAGSPSGSSRCARPIGQDLAQLGDVDLEELRSRGRRGIGPQGVDQLVGRADAASMDRQRPRAAREAWRRRV